MKRSTTATMNDARCFHFPSFVMNNELIEQYRAEIARAEAVLKGLYDVQEYFRRFADSYAQMGADGQTNMRHATENASAIAQLWLAFRFTLRKLQQEPMSPATLEHLDRAEQFVRDHARQILSPQHLREKYESFANAIRDARAALNQPV